MAFVLKDRVKDTTTTTGTGSVTLSGTAPIGYVSFATAIGNGNNTYYTITAGSEWEVGIGTLSATTTLSRDTVLASSNSGSLVNFSAGTKDVFVTYPAGRSVFLNTDSSITIGNSLLSLSSTGVVTSPNIETAVGYKGIPQNLQSGTTYSLAASDIGKHVYCTGSAMTMTVPTGTGIPVGAAITVVNALSPAANISFTTTGTTVYKAGTATAWASGGTLSTRGLATWIKVGTDLWYVSGTGLS